MAPVFTLLEREIVAQTLKLIGYPAMPEGDGILSPGGSMSNMYGIVLARYHYFPEVKKKGMCGLPPLAVFTSEDGHYSITKGAHWLGLGTDNIYKVTADLEIRSICYYAFLCQRENWVWSAFSPRSERRSDSWLNLQLVRSCAIVAEEVCVFSSLLVTMENVLARFFSRKIDLNNF